MGYFKGSIVNGERFGKGTLKLSELDFESYWINGLPCKFLNDENIQGILLIIYLFYSRKSFFGVSKRKKPSKIFDIFLCCM